MGNISIISCVFVIILIGLTALSYTITNVSYTKINCDEQKYFGSQGEYGGRDGVSF